MSNETVVVEETTVVIVTPDPQELRDDIGSILVSSVLDIATIVTGA